MDIFGGGRVRPHVQQGCRDQTAQQHEPEFLEEAVRGADQRDPSIRLWKSVTLAAGSGKNQYSHGDLSLTGHEPGQ